MQFSMYLLALMAPMALAAPLPSSSSSNPAAIVKRGAGIATIHNNCAFDITVNPCFNGGSGATDTIPAGQTWSQPQMDFGGAGEGVSLKLNKADDSADNVAQFEYTVNNIMNLVFYDLSFINGSPFHAFDQMLSGGDGMPSVRCPAGQSPCTDAYFFADQIATKAAPLGTDLNYYICGQ